ncbi:MAG: DUF2764 family protein [Victivallales bacterium]|nr:DUF2764 family protein [Victivallales bacterium]
MAVDLFYFLSTLPTLRAGQKPPFSVQQFLENCRNTLPPKLAAAAERASLLPQDEDSSDTMAAWYAFEAFLRNTTGDIRLTRLPRGNNLSFRKKESNHLSPGDRKLIEDAMALPTPAEREAALDQVRWKFLDSLEACHTFDQDLLEIYAVKLQLLEKQSSRTLETGRAAFQEILRDIHQQALEHRVDAEL